MMRKCAAAFGVVLLVPSMLWAGPIATSVKRDFSGVHVGQSLSEAIATLKKPGYQLLAPPQVSCGDELYLLIADRDYKAAADKVAQDKMLEWAGTGKPVPSAHDSDRARRTRHGRDKQAI